MLRILLIDDNRDDRALAIHELRRVFSEVQVTEVGTAAQFDRVLTDFLFDVVITDYQLHWNDGITILKTIKARHSNCPVIMFTNTATQETAIEAMKSGLDDYVIKSPSHYVRLPSAVETVLKRVAAQQQAAKLQTRIQTLLNQLNVGVYRLTSNGALLEGNAAFLRLLGLGSLTEIPPIQTLELYFEPQDYTKLLTQLRQDEEVRARDCKERPSREIQLRRADGTSRWVKISKTFSRVNGTTIIEGMIEDIDDRKQAELRAEIEHQRSKFLAEASRLLASSLDYRTILKNLVHLAVPTFADICIVDVVKPTSLAFGEPLIAASEPTQAPLLLELRRRYPLPADADYGSVKVLRTGQPELKSHISSSFLKQIAEDAEHLDFLQQLGMKAWIVVPMIAHECRFGTLALIKTKDSHSYDRADLEMAEELGRRTAIALDNARLYQEAQKANQTKDEFLAIVSHELRNPLSSILGWSQLLRKQQFDDPTVNQAVEIIERNAKRQNKLIDDLLDVSRIIHNRLEILPQPVSLASVIGAAIEALQPSAESKAIHISSSFDPSVGQVLGDAYRLEQVVDNLLSNAIKFTPHGGRVEVKLSLVTGHSSLVEETLMTNNKFAQITIADTGKGIPADFLPFLFERFRQAEASKVRTQNGLGLGLAIVRHLVELHGGSVYATSTGEGKGSTFTVQLPIQESSSITTAEDSATGYFKFSTLVGLRVLVVDDELDNRELIAFILEQQQAQVIMAASAAEAFDLISQSDIDILISDIGMPDEDGYSFIRRIRTLQPAPKSQIPAIALTAFAKEEDRQAATAAGFQYYLAKPVNPDDLIETVANLANK